MQKPIVYNKLLPYVEFSEVQSHQQIEEIKVNLSHSIQKFELWPGAVYWTNRLKNFLRVYGLHFSKDDHVHFIHLLFELVTIDNLESPLVCTWASVLTQLLKKPKLLSRDNLCLPWRPLYDLHHRIFESKFAAWGMKNYPQHTCTAVHDLVYHARNYFSVESTQEMLDEWLPLLCPFDLSSVKGSKYLSDFLPTLLPSDCHGRGFRLWFDKLINFWLELPSSSSNEESFVKLFVRLSQHCAGYVNWTPYIPPIFSKILRSFDLPVGQKEFHGPPKPKHSFSSSQAARIIVGMLDGSNSMAQKHLATLMSSLESYYHPSNLGKHTRMLLVFLKELALCFIARLKRERFSKPVWFSETPPGTKLTENCIDEFTQCLLPSLKLAMFSKFGTSDASSVFHSLSLVRPEMVLPDLLSSTYQALETVTEPHQVTATLQCLSAVSRALLSGGMGRYPEGKKHLFTLLMLALPGIDANDFRKTIISGLLISSLVSLVPLVDSSLSGGNQEINKEDSELSSMTAQFEDFVVHFLDRCFGLIDDTRLEQVTALDRLVSSTQVLNHESIMGLGLAGCVQTVLNQCSPQIFQVALEKVYRFASGRVFESEVAGKMCADMCSAAAKVNPTLSLNQFLPYCIQTIETTLSDEEQYEAEHPDHDLLWSLQLLSKVLQQVGNAFSLFSDPLISCLTKCVHLKSKIGSNHASKALQHMLSSLTMTYPLESRSTCVGFSLPPQEHNYIKDWAAPGDIDNLDLKWHTPTTEELQLADSLLQSFLKPEIEELKLFIEGHEMERARLHQSLHLVAALISGVTAYLPDCQGLQVEECPKTVVEFKNQQYLDKSKTPPKEFQRDSLLHFIHQLSDHILHFCENDTKSMFHLIRIISTLLSNFGSTRIEYEGKRHAFSMSKSWLMDKLRGRKNDLRTVLIARAQLQHELRMTEHTLCVLTSTHLQALKDLVRFSISSYAEVRIQAQRCLSDGLDMYLYSSRKILPEIIPFLQRSEVSHEQFKGALYVMMLPSVIQTIVHDWKILRNTLPIIIKADHSEKPSIINLMSKLVKSLVQGYEYFTLVSKVPNICRDKALILSRVIVTSEDVQKGHQLMIAGNAQATRDYSELVEELVRLQDGKLHWRHSEMGVRFLSLMVRHDHPFPVSGVKLVVTSLTHDLVAVRKIALWTMPLILQLYKRPVVKIPVNIAEKMQSMTGCVTPNKEKLGERDSIKWLCYSPEHIPKTKEEWESFPFIDKTHWGYYCWPKTLLTRAPTDAQPPTTRSPDQLSEGELAIYEAFTSQEFVDKFVQFMSLEEVKGKDCYDFRKRLLFKLLFRNYGDSFLPLFLPHLEKMTTDSQENNQRCASEIISGIVGGTKNWPYEMVEHVQKSMQQLIICAIEEITVETIEDWGACVTDISANRDPRKLHWLFEILIRDPLSGKSGSFKDCSRLYLLQLALAQQEWRVPGLLHQLIDYLKSHLSHSFKNVRDSVGAILSQALVCDLVLSPALFNPRSEVFVAELLHMVPGWRTVASLTESEESLRLCKTVLTFLVRCYDLSHDQYFLLFVKMLPLVTVEDGEIRPLLLKVCSRMANVRLRETTIALILKSLKEGLTSELWKVRALALKVLQVLVFQNIFVLAVLSPDVSNLLVNLIEDSQTEVRELAAACVSGLVRCSFLSNINSLKDYFLSKSKTALPSKNQDKSEAVRVYELCVLQRHSGVLGLAALVEAYPYSVPTWLPDVVDELAMHLHDPAPIASTVRKAISEFRRTHHDNWIEHKQKFSDDQLAVLTDLLISPSYYA